MVSLSLNNLEHHKMNFLKMSSWRWWKYWIFHLSNDEICEQKIGICINNYHLQTIHLTPVCLFYVWNWWLWWLFWCHPWSSRCINIVPSVWSFSLMNNLNYVCLMRNRLTLEKCELITMDVQHLTFAFNATICHIHPIVLYVSLTYDKFQKNKSKFTWIKD
jgi:hypothetical protein